MAVDASDGSLAVTFTLRDGDYLAFHKRVRRLTVPLVLANAVRWLLVPCALAFAVYRSPYVAGDLVRAAGLWGAIALLWVGYTTWASRAAILRVNLSRPGARGPRTMRLEPRGIVVETVVTTVLHTWPAFVRIETDAHRLYFYLTPESALIVPRTAFAKPEDAERFLQAARDCQVAAQSPASQDAATNAEASMEAGPPNAIRVRYSLTPDDLLHYYRLVGRGELIRAVLGTVVVCALLIACVEMLYGLSPYLIGLPIIGFYLALVAVMMAVQVDRNRRRKAARQPSSEQLVILTARGVEERASRSESHTAWEKILAIRETPIMFLFTLGPQNAFVIPKRAFGSSEEARVFLQSAQAFRQAALTGTEATPVEQVQSWPPPPRR